MKKVIYGMPALEYISVLISGNMKNITEIKRYVNPSDVDNLGGNDCEIALEYRHTKTTNALIYQRQKC